MPDIFFKCQACGNHLVVDEARRGMTVECPDCRAPIDIPTMLNVQQCPRCAQRLMIAPEMKGTLVHCPSCREAIRAPGLCGDQGAEESSVLMVCPRCRASVAITEEISNRPTPCPSCEELVYFRDTLQVKGSQNPQPPKPKDNDPLRFRRKSR